MTTARTIGGYEFVLVSEIQVDRESAGSIFMDRPQSRYANAADTSLNRYGDGAFCRFRLEDLPTGEGVYCLFVDENPRYVGEAVDLRARWYAY